MEGTAVYAWRFTSSSFLIGHKTSKNVKKWIIFEIAGFEINSSKYKRLKWIFSGLDICSELDTMLKSKKEI